MMPDDEWLMGDEWLMEGYTRRVIRENKDQESRVRNLDRGDQEFPDDRPTPTTLIVSMTDSVIRFVHDLPGELRSSWATVRSTSWSIWDDIKIIGGYLMYRLRRVGRRTFSGRANRPPAS